MGLECATTPQVRDDSARSNLMSSQLGFLCGSTPRTIRKPCNLTDSHQLADVSVHSIARCKVALDGESNEHRKHLAHPKQHVRAIERKTRPVLIDLITDESLENGAAALRIIC